MLYFSRLQKICVILLLQIFWLPAMAQTTWPKEIPATGGSRITIYEPQPEQYNGSSMYARAAVSIVRKTGEEPVFGVMWFNATLTADSRSATVQTVSVAQSKFADN